MIRIRRTGFHFDAFTQPCALRRLKVAPSKSIPIRIAVVLHFSWNMSILFQPRRNEAHEEQLMKLPVFLCED
jgi:putative flippase GtrA